MALSMAEIRNVVQDLGPRLVGGRIERIDQPEPRDLILTIRSGASLYWLLISAHPRLSRLHLLTTRPERSKPAAGFCNVLRQHITGAPVEGLRQVPDDRVVVIESVERDRLMRPHRVSLVAELTGIGSNMVLLDEAGRVLGCLVRDESSRRHVFPGAAYAWPAPPESLPAQAHSNRFAEASDPDDPLSLSRAIESHYGGLAETERVESLRADASRVLRNAAKKCSRRLRDVSMHLERAENAESWRRQGELLKLALDKVAKGQDEIVLEDVFDPDHPQVTIPLKPTLTPAENLERIFRRYKKAKAGRETLSQRRAEAQEELGRLEALLAQVEAAGSVEQIDELKGRMQESGVGVARPARRETARKGPRHFRSADGLDILVARSARENERLSFTLARGNDFWLHVRGWPGPHVVVRTPPDRGLSQEALLDAAHLAVHFSKIRGTDAAEVVYTRCKNLRRQKGARPGTVSYADASTLRVRVEPERVERLLRFGRPPGKGPGG